MRTTLLLLFLNIPLLLAAQFEQWTGVAFEHEVTANWGYEFVGEYRRSLSDGGNGKAQALFAANRKLTGFADLDGGLRYRIPNAGRADELRLFADLNLEQQLGDGPLTLTGRLRYQQDRFPGEDGASRQVALRPRGGCELALVGPLRLFAEAEFRYRFDERDRWVRRRLTAGPAWDITDRHTLELFYRNQHDFGDGQPGTTHIAGLYLAYVLPDRRERDWEYRRPFRRVTF